MNEFIKVQGGKLVNIRKLVSIEIIQSFDAKAGNSFVLVGKVSKGYNVPLFSSPDKKECLQYLSELEKKLIVL